MRRINEDYKAVGDIIHQQIGKKALYMMGTKQLTYVNEGLGGLGIRFTGSRKVNHIKIVLNGRDTYDITFYKIRGVDFKVISEYEDVYVENLHSLIEDETGLRLSL